MSRFSQRPPCHPPGRGLTAARLVSVVLLSWTAEALADPVNVRTAPLVDVLLTSIHSAPATVVARNSPEVAAEIAARVQDLPVQVGDRVTRGELLAQLDCRRYESVLGAAQAGKQRAAAQQRFAERQLARARDLKKKNSISDELLDQRRTELASSQADLLSATETAEQAALDVAHCTVRAPLDAVVSQRLTSIGSYVTPGTPLVGLIETTEPDVSVALRQDQLAGFEAAGAWTFEFDTRSRALALRAILPAADTISRTREARLRFTEPPAVPGSAGRVIWRGGSGLIPAEYLVRREGRLGIFTVDADTARFVEIPGAQEGRAAPSPALAPGLLLVTEGRQRLSDGDAVRRIDE